MSHLELLKNRLIDYDLYFRAASLPQNNNSDRFHTLRYGLDSPRQLELQVDLISPNNSSIMPDPACLSIPQELFLSLAVITDTTRLRKFPCETNIEARYRHKLMKYPG